ncbi:glycosyltransferase [Shewanella algae]|uniref:glycosyltransferase n=1 Tax=Shewanella algae TaxID=38313 RepID=UPI001AADE414|nr:glycosyltransferase [Shewanella algae]MBO2577396.1 glycosyltransferase [Shewanella algae]MBO2682961.1 glycosyltransferase [Shewanella algae]
MQEKKMILPVDILAANFNNGKYLDDFFCSIYQSTALPNRIIFVDDKSTDNSLEIVGQWITKLPQLFVVKLKKNVGFANALNEGCKHIVSEYVARIDPDDTLEPERLEAQYEFMVKNNIDVLGSNVSYFIDDEMVAINHSKFPTEHDDILARYQEGSHGVCHGAVMLAKVCLESEQYRQEYVPAEEYDIFSRLLCRGFIFGNLGEVLTSVRVHAESVSNNMPYATVEKTFKLRQLIWGQRTSRLVVFKEYLVRNNYRKYLFAKGIERYLFLVLASFLKPKAVMKRLLK